MMNAKNTVLVGLGSFLLAGLVACGDDAPTPPSKPGNGAAGLNRLTGGGAPPPKAPPAPPPAPATPPPSAGAEGDDDVADLAYAYSPIGKRDPFRSLFDQLKLEDGAREVTELQKFKLDQLRLVAVVSRIATPYAMVEDPDGKGHTLTRGILIGKNWGRVAQINPECVVIKEEYRDYTGRKVTNKTSKCLPKPQDLKLD